MIKWALLLLKSSSSGRAKKIGDPETADIDYSLKKVLNCHLIIHLRLLMKYEY